MIFRTTEGSVEEVVWCGEDEEAVNCLVSKQFEVIRALASLVVFVLSFASNSEVKFFVFVEACSIAFVVHSGSKLVSLKEKSSLGSKRKNSMSFKCLRLRDDSEKYWNIMIMKFKI